MIVRNRQYVTLKGSTLNNRGCVVPPKLDGLIIHGNFVEQRKLFF
jgi:hypothetical protein